MNSCNELLNKILGVLAVISLITGLAYSANLLAAGKNGLASKREQSKWSTPSAELAGVTLVRRFDSSGPDAWDVKKHPLVFMTTEGPGYGGLMSGVTNPGLAIFDADSREVVASVNFDVLDWGWKNVFEPHGLGVSPDGRWIYLPTGEGSFMTTGEHAGRYLIINARTLKIDKVIRLSGQAHHAKSYVTPEGKQRIILYGWSQPLFLLDPDDDNRVVAAVSLQDQGTEAYTYFASPDGDQIIGTGRYRSYEMRKHLKDNPIILFDPDTLRVKKYINVEDSAPVWMAFSSDNKYVYITGSRNSVVFKYDRVKERIVAEQRAGVDGPYGVHLGWDDRYLITIGKGEESHNRGKMVGLVDAETMEVPGSRSMDQIYTGCIRGDHGTLHPDPDANELWISCNSSFEVVIFDLDLKEVSARLPLPHGGSTHSGAFVQYPDGWESGEVASDMNGLHGSALKFKRELLSGN